MSVRIAVLDDYQHVAREYADWSALPADAEITAFDEHIADESELVRRLEPFEVVAAMRERTPFPRRVLEALPKLKLLVTTGMSNASIDMEAAGRLGITVSGTGNSSSSPAATTELTWGLILALTRAVPAEDRRIREGGWQHTIGMGLSGRTLGLVGLGRLGTQVANLGRAFGMDTIAWSQHLTAETAEAAGVKAVGKRELFATADVISIHVRLSDRTRGLVGAEEIGLMSRDAYLVNTSRGPIVDEAALRDALWRGRIAGAGIDVFEREPLPADDPWRSVPRTVLTPHIGYVTAPTYETFYTETVEDILAHLAGAPVRVLN
ncbi:phosphoglycerate dehydrogenase-like enzyme [Saccharopolyspora lacisalsi]|uniref:Phosphoglycerate dehydrogenase-like enzyme n=1 Tax=Halosaccharopolyspora lacisalsi TaxID=1000566 RepID=A0A839E1Y1_9PSEU|nr:D-2-hydroxyacid dehydrogenase family protein [Halosaccharopolyspora lacisalsi]MBA8825757.1 phosphoglycerate dehydrogenase-like enzyme [Halosaccharopolyspora lacisalsi]